MVQLQWHECFRVAQPPTRHYLRSCVLRRQVMRDMLIVEN